MGHCRESFFSRFKCYRILNWLDGITLLLENVKSFDFNTMPLSLPNSFFRILLDYYSVDREILFDCSSKGCDYSL